MRRKIVKQGLGGCTVSLPIKWIRENKLSPRDEVELKHQGKNLLISGKGTSHKKQKEIYIKEADNLPIIRSIISSAYKAGYDELFIHSQHLPSFKNINEIINTFTGLEVLSQTKDTLRIKSFLQEDENQIENMIIKMFQTINAMIKNIIEDWDKIDLENIKALTEISIRRTRDYCLRIIHLNNYDNDKAYDYCVLITHLEKIASQLGYVAEYIMEESPLNKKLLLDFQKDYESFYHCYLKKDFGNTNDLWGAHHNKVKKMFDPETLSKLVKEQGALAAHYYNLTMHLRTIASRMLALSL